MTTELVTFSPNTDIVAAARILLTRKINGAPVVDPQQRVVGVLRRLRDAGIAQMQRSAELMNSEVIDLMQVHNLRDTDVHLATIREWQEQGRIRAHF